MRQLAAAVKIQSRVRGFLVRHRRRIAMAPVEDDAERERRMAEQLAEAVVAATRIQSHMRGLVARKLVK
eukprot:3702877-Pyramimonas_sp.AAC.1